MVEEETLVSRWQHLSALTQLHQTPEDLLMLLMDTNARVGNIAGSRFAETQSAAGSLLHGLLIT